MRGQKNNKSMEQSSKELRQKVIYFQKEAAKYKFLSEKYEILLSKALQSTHTLDKPEEDKPNYEERSECTPFFNYTIIQDKESTPFVFGSFVLKNSGNCTLHIPIICIKVNKPASIVIGGKMGEVEGTTDKLMDSFEEWSYVSNDWRQKWNEEGELWLKPKHLKKINPGEKLVFSGFDITFNTTDTLETIIVDGFCYFQEITNGIKSLNSISITL